MDSVRSLLLVPADDAQDAVDLGQPPDATLVDLMHAEAGGDAAAGASIDAFLEAGHRLYLHTRGPQSADLRDQLLATLRAGVYGVSLPGLVQLDQLRFVDSLLEDVEHRLEIEPGLTAIGLWIESAAALGRAGELAAGSSRLTWLGVGATQLAMELALDAPAAALLDHARARVVFAAQAAGLPAVEGLQPGQDPDAEAAQAAVLRTTGLRGRLTRHPATVVAFNGLFPAAAD